MNEVLVPDLTSGSPSSTLVPDGELLNQIGKLIEKQRCKLGLTRETLGKRLGVTAQTILNIETDPEYNLGTRLLRRLEKALNVEFTIQMSDDPTSREATMTDRIRMGNDEFILHIRKNYRCDVRNPQLGRRIWVWLRDNADGVQISGQRDCLWSPEGGVGELQLPSSATQFEFRINALPDLYRFLGQLGEGTAPSETESDAEA